MNMKPVIQILNWKITGHPVPASMNHTGEKLLWYTLEGTVETDDKIAKEVRISRIVDVDLPRRRVETVNSIYILN